MNKETVRAWQTADPLTVIPTTTLHEAHAIMQAANIRHLPVVQGRKLVGLITLHEVRQAELMIAAVYKGSDLDALVSQSKPVGEMMDGRPPTVAPDDMMADAAQLLLTRKLTATAVVENGRLVGILTESDIFRFVAHLRQTKSLLVGNHNKQDS
jgi:acetoin utilization protein AcuB